MLIEFPQISGSGYWRQGKPARGGAVRRVGRALLKVTEKLIDLHRLEAGDGDVEVLANQELGEFGNFDRQPLPIPAGVLAEFVISN
jgi:hypothetical protein